VLTSLAFSGEEDALLRVFFVRAVLRHIGRGFEALFVEDALAPGPAGAVRRTLEVRARMSPRFGLVGSYELRRMTPRPLRRIVATHEPRPWASRARLHEGGGSCVVSALR
jgi:hypothetical protein